MTGYGNLSRAIMLGLKMHTDVQLAVRHRVGAMPDWVQHRELLEEIPVVPDSTDFDVTLRISPPSRPVVDLSETTPSVIYTQNALGDLLPEWVDNLSGVKAVIVPGEFDARVFRRYFSNVHVCTQYVEEKTFRPMVTYRPEGAEEKSFIFVGSYSYRKGVDLMLNAFCKAFPNGEKVHLTLHCFSGLEKNGINDLIARLRPIPDNVRISVFNGSITPPWMARIYNQHDAVVSFSRGEGWCMPLHEGLLCGKPVLAPDSTAMGEHLPRDGVRRMAVEEREISSITEPFGGGMRNHYGFAGNTMWDVTEADAVAALRDVYENLDSYTEAAAKGREFVLSNYSKKALAGKIVSALESAL
jgi:glycosyltransferase involved in cell wall biosynthesis